MLIGNLLQAVYGIQTDLTTYLMGMVWLFQIEMFLPLCNTDRKSSTGGVRNSNIFNHLPDGDGLAISDRNVPPSVQC